MSDAEPSLTLDSKKPSPFKHFIHSNYPFVFAALILGGGSLLLGYSIGHKQGLTVVGFSADAEQLNEVVQEQKKAIGILNTSLNTAVQERDLALGNTKDLTDNLRKETESRQQIEQQRDIYREVLRLRGGVALNVQMIDIKPLPERAFEYRIDLMQIQPNRKRATGTLQVRLINGEDTLVVPMSDNKFDFDTFQRLTGRWTMPSGFTPQFVEVRLSGRGGDVVRRYAWERGQAIDTMPAILSEIPQAAANAD